MVWSTFKLLVSVVSLFMMKTELTGNIPCGCYCVRLVVLRVMCCVLRGVVAVRFHALLLPLDCRTNCRPLTSLLVRAHSSPLEQRRFDHGVRLTL